MEKQSICPVRLVAIFAAVFLICIGGLATNAYAEELDDNSASAIPAETALTESEASVQRLPDYVWDWYMFPDVKAEMQSMGDDERPWYYKDGHFTYVVMNQIMNGYAGEGRMGGNWGPYDYATRAQVATIIYRAENPKSKNATESAYFSKSSNFADVPGNQYYTAAINWCEQKGIMQGYGGRSATHFGPNASITREELATVMARYASYHGINTADADDTALKAQKGYKLISDWALEGMTWCAESKLIVGIDNGDGTFSNAPQKKTWRASLAKIIHIFDVNMLGKKDVANWY